MIGGQALLTALTVIGLFCASSIVVIAVATFGRGRAVARSRALIEPYRRAVDRDRLRRGRWRLEGWWASLRGKKPVWGVMTRQGFDDATPALDVAERP